MSVVYTKLVRAPLRKGREAAVQVTAGLRQIARCGPRRRPCTHEFWARLVGRCLSCDIWGLLTYGGFRGPVLPLEGAARRISSSEMVLAPASAAGSGGEGWTSRPPGVRFRAYTRSYAPEVRCGPATADIAIQPRVVRLLEYLEAVRGLRELPVRDVADYQDRRWWAGDIPDHPACVISATGAEPWLTVSKAEVAGLPA